MVLGGGVSPLNECKTHLINTSEHGHNGPPAELCCVISDLLSQAHGGLRVEILGPILALVVPFRQHVGVKQLILAFNKAVDCTPNADLGLSVKFEDVIVVTLVADNLILVFNEGVWSFERFEFLRLHAVLVLVRDFHGFLHQLAHAVHTVLIKGLEFDRCCLVHSLEVEHVLVFTLVNEQETFGLFDDQIPRVLCFA
jgi:hypothetical protein